MLLLVDFCGSFLCCDLDFLVFAFLVFLVAVIFWISASHWKLVFCSLPCLLLVFLHLGLHSNFVKCNMQIFYKNKHDTCDHFKRKLEPTRRDLFLIFSWIQTEKLLIFYII